MKISIIIFQLTLIHGLAFGQFNKAMSDSVILAKTSRNFFDCLTFVQSKKQAVWDNDKILQNKFKTELKENDIKVQVQTFDYRLKTKSGEPFYYRMDGLTSTSIEVNFDEKGEMINPPLFADLKQISAINDLNIIVKMTAIDSASPYLTNKKVKTNECLLIFDIDKDLIYWEIRSRKGRKNTFEQRVLINAQTNEYIRTDEFKYQRSLF